MTLSLLDTKYMANVPPLKEIITATALGDMEKIVSKDPFPEIVLGSFVFRFKLLLGFCIKLYCRHSRKLWVFD